MASGKLTFSAFFEAIHGYAPFPWQRRLAQTVVEEGRWPRLLDLPTGTGKTSAIDVALFALARRPEIFPRRIVLVVDRRVVVDQGADHARTILAAMTSAKGGAALEVADALRSLFGGGRDDVPFLVSVMRGGMPRDESWADRPDRAVVALSTVDQVGSRLLFRGYGVSPRMAPIHAGLLGNDTLFLLDEVQLSTAFSETLRALESRWRTWHARSGGATLPDRWAAVRMSATPIGDPEDTPPFQLDQEDHTHPVLAQRLGSRKIAKLEPVKVSREEHDRVELFAAACANAAKGHLDAGSRTIAIVVNRVDTARRINRLFHESGDRQFDLALLTGRMRPLDRIDLMGSVADPSSVAGRVIAGRNRSALVRPIIVVATQCIEAGADFDFDALVTECASLDALRQRFGRLDRRGELGECRATIVARHDQVDGKEEDAIYGGALAATWKWLSSVVSSAGEIDFGMTGFPSLPGELPERESLFSAVIHSPVLMPAHIDAWAQTNPRPEPDPEVALWLHGPGRDVAEVRIVWRADLSEDLLKTSILTDGQLQSDELLPQFAVAPPSSLESISIPLVAARSWLTNQESGSFGDVEGSRAADRDRRPKDVKSVARRCVRLGRNSATIIEPGRIRPGDTLIVPSSYGGVVHGTWDPGSRSGDFVPDVGDWAQLIHRGRPVLRLVPEVIGNASATQAGTVVSGPSPLDGSTELARRVPRKSGSDDLDFDVAAEVASWINLARTDSHSRLRVLIDAVAPAHDRKPRYGVVNLARGHFAVIGRRRVDPAKLSALAESPTGEILTEDDDSSSFIGTELGLRKHLSDVRAQTEVFARSLGIADDLIADVALAAWLHDVGKADRRFQQILVGGSEFRLALQLEPLAKSAGESLDAVARARARQRSGYPAYYRHEVLSVVMLEQTEGALVAAHDPDLVLHLVGSHHGWCRPFVPGVDPGPSIPVSFDLDGLLLHGDTAHSLARFDSSVADRFFRLVDRYGWWGLAWLEAIMRLADHRASEAARHAVSEPAIQDCQSAEIDRSAPSDGGKS